MDRIDVAEHQNARLAARRITGDAQNIAKDRRRLLAFAHSAVPSKEDAIASGSVDARDVARRAFDLHDAPGIGKDGTAVDRVLKKGGHFQLSVGDPVVFQVAQNFALKSIARPFTGAQAWAVIAFPRALGHTFVPRRKLRRVHMTLLRFPSPWLSRRSVLIGAGALAAAGSSSSVLAQTVLGVGKTPPHLRFLQPDTSSKQLGYTHVVEATVPGRIVYVAGQMGLDSNGNLVGAPGDFKAQATQAWENVRAALGAAGGNLEHIVKITQFLVHLRAHQALLREVRAKFANPDMPPPASTMVQIGALAREGALYEVEAVAVLPPS
jgi:enamine deaminase RidA (YjgF/YER057c/UK114 family)